MTETTQTTDPRMQVLLDLYDVHTDYFRRALEGIREEDTHKRLDTEANHPAWIAGSTVESRFESARQLGADVQSSGHALFANHQGIQDDATYPTLQQYLADWEKITPLCRQKLAEAGPAWLDNEIDMGEWKATGYELAKFMTYREANMIGQIALWRRLLGYPGISYM